MRRTLQLSRRNSLRAGVSGQAMRRTLLLLTLLAAFAAAPAQGASRLVIDGAGFGHGVGMSQYGAYGFAEKGADHAKILRHYYTGTQIGRLDGGGSQVRVLLKSAGRIVLTNAASVSGERRLDPGRRYIATGGLGDAVTLRSATGRHLGSYGSPLTITGAGGGFQINGRSGHAASDGRYRGELQIRATLGGVSAINAVALDDYIRGVVAGEMPSGWPQEALRAQAVAARTYALATSKQGDGFDQYADTRSQVYNGIAGETAATDEAVAATSGEVVTYQGKPIVTYYFSTSGGRTEDLENSFLGASPVPYLRSVDDPYDSASPRHRWTRQMSLRSAQRRLGRLVQGRLRRIKVLRRGASPRVVSAQVIGSGGRTNVSGPTLRRKLGLYDTWARFTVITASGRRGDGNTPSAAATPSGGATPRLARAASLGMRVGTIAGRVDPVTAGRSWVSVQHWDGRRWRARFDLPVRASGRYAGRVRATGLYRVLYRGVVGPRVLVR